MKKLLKTCKIMKKANGGWMDRPTDRPTDRSTNGPTNGPTKWLIESRARHLKSILLGNRKNMGMLKFEWCLSFFISVFLSYFLSFLSLISFFPFFFPFLFSSYFFLPSFFSRFYFSGVDPLSARPPLAQGPGPGPNGPIRWTGIGHAKCCDWLDWHFFLETFLRYFCFI